MVQTHLETPVLFLNFEDWWEKGRWERCDMICTICWILDLIRVPLEIEFKLGLPQFVRGFRRLRNTLCKILDSQLAAFHTAKYTTD